MFQSPMHLSRGRIDLGTLKSIYSTFGAMQEIRQTAELSNECQEPLLDTGQIQWVTIRSYMPPHAQCWTSSIEWFNNIAF